MRAGRGQEEAGPSRALGALGRCPCDEPRPRRSGRPFEHRRGGPSRASKSHRYRYARSDRATRRASWQRGVTRHRVCAMSGAHRATVRHRSAVVVARARASGCDLGSSAGRRQRQPGITPHYVEMDVRRAPAMTTAGGSLSGRWCFLALRRAPAVLTESDRRGHSTRLSCSLY